MTSTNVLFFIPLCPQNLYTDYPQIWRVYDPPSLPFGADVLCVSPLVRPSSLFLKQDHNIICLHASSLFSSIEASSCHRPKMWCDAVCGFVFQLAEMNTLFAASFSPKFQFLFLNESSPVRLHIFGPLSLLCAAPSLLQMNRNTNRIYHQNRKCLSKIDTFFPMHTHFTLRHIFLLPRPVVVFSLSPRHRPFVVLPTYNLRL